MSLDPELELWRQEWQLNSEDVAGDVEAVRSAAIRQETRMRRRLTLELCFTLLVLPISVVIAWKVHRTEMVLWAGVIWLLTIVTTAITLWNWQTLWKDSARSVHDFRILSRKRVGVALRSVAIGYWVLGVNIVIAFGWYLLDLALRRIEVWRFFLGSGLIVLISLLFIFILRRRRADALHELESIGPQED